MIRAMLFPAIVVLLLLGGVIVLHQAEPRRLPPVDQGRAEC